MSGGIEVFASVRCSGEQPGLQILQMPQGIAVRFRLWSVFIDKLILNYFIDKSLSILQSIQKPIIPQTNMYFPHKFYFITLESNPLQLDLPKKTIFNQVNYLISMFANKTIPKIAVISGAAILAAFGLAYSYFKNLNLNSQSSAKMKLTLQTTQKIVQQIKYQMLLLCMTFTQKFKEYLQTNLNERELQILEMKLRENMMKFYEQKETIITEKYQISREQFAEAISDYQEDVFIIKNQEEIKQMMERAIKGKLPDFQVPQEALDLLSLQQIREIYQELSFSVAKLVWLKIMECIRLEPNFNTQNDEDFKRAIRSISIYDYKMIFLVQKGFKKEWGCPNQTFFKVIEINKTKNAQFRQKIINIQRAYQVLIEKVSHFPKELTEEGLKLLFQAKINNNQKNSSPNKGQAAITKKPKIHKLAELTDEYKQFIGRKNEKQQEIQLQQCDKEAIKSHNNPVVQL